MIKKNTYSFYHKRIRTALCAVLCSVLTAMPAFATSEDNSPTAAASTTVWTKASEIMQDVYSQIISIPPHFIRFVLTLTSRDCSEYPQFAEHLLHTIL